MWMYAVCNLRTRYTTKVMRMKARSLTWLLYRRNLLIRYCWSCRVLLTPKKDEDGERQDEGRKGGRKEEREGEKENEQLTGLLGVADYFHLFLSFHPLHGSLSFSLVFSPSCFHMEEERFSLKASFLPAAGSTWKAWKKTSGGRKEVRAGGGRRGEREGREGGERKRPRCASFDANLAFLFRCKPCLSSFWQVETREKEVQTWDLLLLSNSHLSFLSVIIRAA